jgi:hypothetical protein
VNSAPLPVVRDESVPGTVLLPCEHHASPVSVGLGQRPAVRRGDAPASGTDRCEITSMIQLPSVRSAVPATGCRSTAVGCFAQSPRSGRCAHPSSERIPILLEVVQMHGAIAKGAMWLRTHRAGFLRSGHYHMVLDQVLDHYNVGIFIKAG